MILSTFFNLIIYLLFNYVLNKHVFQPEPLSYRLQGVWKEEQHQSSIPNAYESLNFVVEGYDMVLVEDFSKFIHRLMLRRNQKVVEV